MEESTAAEIEFFARTLRARPPEETLSIIQPLFRHMGITRLANVTGLDDIGIPVWQAIRPNARLLSVSQGKGVTHAAAKVSAAMESIELWHAENLPLPTIRMSVRDIAGELGYSLDQLPKASRHCLSYELVLDWVSGTRLLDGAPTLVPDSYLRLDGRVRETWSPPLFQVSTNGLASGNVPEEAILHGLLEVIERAAMCEEGDRPEVDLESVTGIAGEIVKKLRDARQDIQIRQLANSIGVACFGVELRSDDLPAAFDGYGCHLHRDIALVRALTEAAQSRVTAIAGTRDDIQRSIYRSHRIPSARSERANTSRSEVIGFDSVPEQQAGSLQEAISVLVERVYRATGTSVLLVGLTRPEFALPVVRVVCPGLRCPEKI